MAVLYDGKGNVVNVGDDSNAYKIIAHRGYSVNSKENTLEAYLEAIENGFKWIEIDIQQCADGVFVMAHNASYTMYDNGTAVSVTWADANYADIKNYTWDSEGTYRLATLQSVFQKLKAYKVTLVCDRKSGTNAEIMEVAARCGAVDLVLLSYGSFAAATADAELLKRYPNVPIRCVPSNYADYIALTEAVTNTLYADCIGTTTVNMALSCGIPILFVGSLANASIWQVIAAGVMSASGNISHGDLSDAFTDIDYNVSNDITPSATELSVAVNETADLTAESTLDTPAGYIYAYSKDPTIATIAQSVFGASITATITGRQAGSTEIVLFSGNGEEKTVVVTVT